MAWLARADELVTVVHVVIAADRVVIAGPAELARTHDCRNHVYLLASDEGEVPLRQ
jgi:hypothetical protein